MNYGYFIFIIYLFLQSFLYAQEVGYNEIFDESGRIRPEYKNVYPLYLATAKRKTNKIIEKSITDFSGDNALFPLPRIISEEDYQILEKGVIQRAKALKMFLEDYYTHGLTWKQVIPKKIVNKIIERSGETSWKQFLKHVEFNFWYGPDIIRGVDGHFYVIEDNPGYIGGMGDLSLARDTLYKHMPEFSKMINSPDPNIFYQDLATTYKNQAKKHGGVAVILSYSDEQVSDNEDSRLGKIFDDLGIFSVRHNTYKKKGKYQGNRYLKSDEEGIWMITKDQYNRIISRQKVGYLVLNMEVMDADWSHAGNHHKRILEEVNDLLSIKRLPPEIGEKVKNLKTPEQQTGKIKFNQLETFLKEDSGYETWLDDKLGIPGLWDHVINGRLGSSYTPGMEFIGDKEFYIYVEAMIEHYLKEEPILRNIKTRSFAMLKPEEIDEIFLRIQHYVVKGVGGRGGDAVWVGPKVDENAKYELKEMILKDPANYIVQDYTPLSFVDDHIVDSRLLSAVTPEGVIVSKVPWGRGLPKNGDGKVNLSSKGKEFVVLVDRRKNTDDCYSLAQAMMR